ncbi:phosphoglycolate phosphatase [Kiloniella laminariae]|uniref:phosphoglycolate phosphatase n=1 Tax=Kiloniella laminariae TaxID=454162 RepID=A0ABT4LHU0_9PROT|nr:phosphoglycolate phosphatase [Kiloniella laminariae]MCZ4280658.1 phosphoglycolate phosphatase [Kiloniella laminariae]
MCDLDGTLIDSAPDLALTLCLLLRQDGRREPDLAEVKNMIGDGATKLVERGYAATGDKLSEDALTIKVKEFLSIYNDHLAVGTVLYPHVTEQLQALKHKGWRLAICTNKPFAPTRQLLSLFDLEPLFEKAVGGDSYPVKKPDGDHILCLLKEMDADPQQAIMLGDGKNDVLAARNAGIPSILFTQGYGTEAARALGPDYILDSYQELSSLPPFAG